MLFFDDKKRELKQKKECLKSLYDVLDSLYEKRDYEDCDLEQVKIEIDNQLKMIDDYIENDYSKFLFDYYSVKRPTLIRNYTGETVTWEKAFGNDFLKLTKGEKVALSSLPDGEGMYKLK